MLTQFLVKADYIGLQALFGVGFFDIGTAALDEPSSQRLVVQQAPEAGDETGCVLRGDGDSALADFECRAVLDDAPLDGAQEVDHSADGRADHRSAARHRLEQSERRSFIARRERHVVE